MLGGDVMRGASELVLKEGGHKIVAGSGEEGRKQKKNFLFYFNNPFLPFGE